jgi:hypothetical protein
MDDKKAQVTTQADDGADDHCSPAPVRRAFIARTIVVCRLNIPPLTLQKWFALQEATSPFSGSDWPEDRIHTLQALCTAIEIFAERDFKLDDLIECCEPSKVSNIIEAINEQVRIGFSTALPMRDPNEPFNKKAAKSSYDPFGWELRFLIYVCDRFKLDPNIVLTTPLAQLFAIVAAAYSIEGKVPDAMDYRGKKA